MNGSPILLRDIGWARAGGPPQQNMVHVNGHLGLLLPVLKNGGTSTTSIVDTVKSMLPGIVAAAPKDIHILSLFDQSIFVTDAIKDVAEEGVIAAGLTGLMILLFLGSWRPTLVVLVSIPLAVLTSLAVLAAMGESMNVMTLGGLALAVGILVDDATVAIENTYRVLEDGKPFREAVVEGAATIAKPTLISTLSICSAFVSVLFLTGAPKYIFTPQALAVVFAMLASYLLSRTLVPILIDVLVGPEQKRREEEEKATDKKKPGWFARFHKGFERRFERFHRGYLGLLHAVLARRLATSLVAGVVLVVAGCLFPFLGRDYFPTISSGQITLHVRARPGARIEETAKLFQGVEDIIRQQGGPGGVQTIVDNIGLPSITYNLAFNDGTFVGYNDGQILATLKPGLSSAVLTKKLRVVLHQRYPDSVFYFQPADMITQILDFGVPSQVDVQVHGRHQADDLAMAMRIENRLRNLRGLVDVHLQQITNSPEFFTEVDRQRAAELGLSEQDVANQVNISLSGQLPGGAELLDRPQDRHPLAAHGADAGIPGGRLLHRRQHADLHHQQRRGERAADHPAAQRGLLPSRRGTVGGKPRQHRADLRHLCGGAGPRPRLSRRRDQPGGGAGDQAHPGRRQGAGARPDREHEQRLHPYRDRPRRGGDRGLPADGAELPGLGRPVRGAERAAAGVLRHRVLLVHHPHHLLDRLADGGRS